jgi:hypothetical protein
MLSATISENFAELMRLFDKSACVPLWMLNEAGVGELSSRHEVRLKVG